MFNPFTRGEFLTFSKDLLGTAAVAARLRLSETLGEHMRSRIFTDSEIRNLDLILSYSDLGSFQLKNNMGVDGNASNFCELVGISDRELQGSYITWIAEQKHLQPDVSIENRSFPHREMVYLNSPTAGRRIVYTDGGRVVVREVEQIFPEIDDSDDVNIYAGGVVVRSTRSGKFDGSDWKIYQFIDGEFIMIDAYQNYFNPPLDIPPQLKQQYFVTKGSTENHSTHDKAFKKHKYLTSSSMHLVRIDRDENTAMFSVVGSENYPSVMLASQYNLKEILDIPCTSEAQLFLFRDFVGAFVLDRKLDDLSPKIKYVVTNGKANFEIDLDVSMAKIYHSGLSVEFNSNFRDMEEISEEIEEHRDFYPLGIVSFSSTTSDGYTSTPTPWILIGIDPKQRIRLIETKASTEFFNSVATPELLNNPDLPNNAS